MLERLVERDPGFYPSKERKVLGKMKMVKNCCGMVVEERENIEHAQM